MRRAFLLACGAIAVSGCGVVRRAAVYKPFAEVLGLQPVGPVEDDVQYPQVGAQGSSPVGTSIVNHARVTRNVALDVRSPYVAKGRWDEKVDYTIAIPAGRLIRTAIAANGDEYFAFRLKPTVTWVYSGTPNGTNEIRASVVRAVDGALSVFWTYPGEEFDFYTLATAGLDAIRTMTDPVSSPTAFRRELVYTGRSGGTLSLLYRELSNDMARPAFSQALQYDISSDPVIGYQGARFRVISADNTGITYEVLAPLSAR